MYSRILVPLSVALPLAAAVPLNIFCERSPIPELPTSGPTCSKADSTQLSCHNTTSVSNLCCFNSPGGQLLLTQFWDTNPSVGPVDSWTLHGLWPDNCDGSYEQFCDKARETTDITGVLQSFGKTDLLNYMNTYWKSNDGNDESFWEHEWNKHGTCISTFDPPCYPGAKKGQDIVDYTDKAVSLFKNLATYNILASAGITPSSSKTYALADLQAAIVKVHGKEATLNCNSGVLTEVWYHYNVYGSAQSGQYVAANPIGSKSTCPATGIKYVPKSGGGGGSTTTTTKTTTTTGGPTSTPTGGSGDPFSGKGYLNVDKGGCLISTGKWYTKGTCATYTATASGSGFTLKSSKGNCDIVSGEFQCGPTVSAGTFAASGGKLANGSATSFYTSGDANDGSQLSVFTTSDGRTTTLTITWQSL
ncbi:hypothetical protein H072_6049 [Dactylellina haptotyla CBS 200.50]|uniref:Ribonuclease T2-like n=1 Tax=Dactylellina haptotyla (strain CBS 200.50) TaxID=1284197 RepID=S8BXV2_DACHA|nr:hypothetical protein H072_6049 [Dactylellina haptotyla CBS 200.50]